MKTKLMLSWSLNRKTNSFIKLLLFFLGLLTINNLSAQTTTDKINTGAYKVYNGASSVNNANNAVNNAAGTVANTKETVKNVKKVLTGVFGGKKDKATQPETKKDTVTAKVLPPATVNNISFSITGIDYSKLKQVEDSVKTLLGVKNTAKKFNAVEASTIEVQYAGQPDELWDALPENLKSMFNLKNIGEKIITLETKK